jgi:hypothetical protein
MNAPDAPSGVRYAISGAYSEFKCFFGTSTFFIILGCVFLYLAYSIMEHAHASFVFLLAILGVAIVLYGTGTQATATTEQIASLPVKATVFGGAGLLAALFGYGVVWKAKEIPEVFKPTRRYERIILKNNFDPKLNLKSFNILATTSDDRPLHILPRQGFVEILVPISGFTQSTTICVEVKNQSGTELTDPSQKCQVLQWHDLEQKDLEFAISRVATGSLPLAALQNRLDEAGQPAEKSAVDAK